MIYILCILAGIIIGIIIGIKIDDNTKIEFSGKARIRGDGNTLNPTSVLNVDKKNDKSHKKKKLLSIFTRRKK